MKKKKLYKNNIIIGFFRKAALGMVVSCALIGLLFVFSCTLLEDYPQASGDDNDTNDTAEEENIAGNDNDTETTDENETGEKEESDREEAAEEEESEDITINVYYSDDMGQYLVGEERIVSSENKYIDALNELMELPADSSLHRLIPESTKINSVTIENSLAKVDLSKEFVEDRFQSDTVDIMLIYSIVNTLTEFPEVNSVSLYIDGEKLDILGELAIDEPIFRRSDLIKE